MKKIEFTGNPKRDALVLFTNIYLQNKTEIFELVKKSQLRSLFFTKIIDDGVSLSEPLSFSVESVEGECITVLYCDPHHEELQKKVIRLDNILGEVPVLEKYIHQYKKMFDFKKEFDNYQLFVREAKVLLSEKIEDQKGSQVCLRYKNDDGSESFIDCIVDKISNSNIDCIDIRKQKWNMGRLISSHIVENKTKHRFISNFGVLIAILPSYFDRKQIYDEGEIFGKEIYNLSFV